MTIVDALFFGPHPDDVEIAASGTILRLKQGGRSAAIVDLTDGGMGSRGTAADRAQEAAAASAMLEVTERVCLGLPDTGLHADDSAVALAVAEVRRLQPRLLFAPHERDVHPDHSAAAQIAAKAWFLAGLVRYRPDLGAPHRPRLLIRYPGNVPVEPTFVVDISEQLAAKDAVIGCYQSQLKGSAPAGRSHFVQGLDIRERAQVRDRFWGARIGCAAAEPFVVDGPLPIADLGALF